MNFKDLYLTLLSSLVIAKPSSPRGLQTRELCGVNFRIDDLRNNILVHHVRNLNYRFMVAEWLWIALGRNDVATIARYNKKIAEFSDDSLTFAGAYGPRLAPQWQWIINKFEHDPDTRQAIVSIWTPNPPGSRDIPCTLNLQFLYRDHRLNCIATMRSSDVYLGLPYDVFNFSMLTNCLAGELGFNTGWLQMNLGSSHLYDVNYEQAVLLVQDSNKLEVVHSPKLMMFPPDIFNEVRQWETPWREYHTCLTAHTRVEALEILKCLA